MMSLVYMIFMIIGTLLVLTSSSWFVVWVGLEMNMMGFIPFVGVGGEMLSEGIFSYFLIQSVGSMILFFIGVFGGLNFGYWMFVYDLMFNGGLIVLVISLKVGAAPFHFWVLSVSDGLDWMSMTVMLTWQKLAPLGLIFVSGWDFGVVVVIGILSVMVGGWGGFNQLIVKSIMVYSSVSHLGWMILLFMISSLVGISYFFLYVVVSLGVIMYFWGTVYVHVGQMFFSGVVVNYSLVSGFCTSLFSLGGLPPFLGFYASWMGVVMMLSSGYFWLVMFYVLIGLTTLYFYLRLGYVWMMGMSFGSMGWGVSRGDFLYMCSLLGVWSLSMFFMLYLV